MAGLTKFVSQKPENIKSFTHVELTNKAEMSNDIGEGEIRLLGEEYNLVCVLLSAINKNAEQFEDCSISMKSVIDKMDDYGGSSGYTRIRKLIDKMMSTGHDKIKFTGIGVKGWISWFDYIAYSTFEDDKESKIYYKFHNKLAPSLLKLGQKTPDGNFVGFLVLRNLDEMISFKGMYTNRIYTWIVKSAKIGHVTYYVEDIVRMLGGEVKESYIKKTSDLKRRIIEPSVKEINEKSAKYDITLCDIKDGRRIVGFEFVIKSKKAAAGPVDKVVDAEVIVETAAPADGSSEQGVLAEKVFKYGVTGAQVTKYVDSFGYDLVADTIEYSIDQSKITKIDNFGGFLKKALERGDAKGWIAQKAKNAAQKKNTNVPLMENDEDASSKLQHNQEVWDYFLSLDREGQQTILNEAISNSAMAGMFKGVTVDTVVSDRTGKYKAFMRTTIERHMNG